MAPRRAAATPSPRPGAPVLRGARSGCLRRGEATHADAACPAYASSPLLWEVRAHAPPSGFARSWLVKGRAVPSTVGAGELLAATPLDLTFSALHELLGDAQRCDRVARTFMLAAGLHRAGAWPSQLAPPPPLLVARRGAGGEDWRSPRSACARLTAELSAWSGADDTQVGCGGPHGWTADRGRGRRRRPCALPRLTGGLAGHVQPQRAAPPARLRGRA
ncbi:hypothetical protein LdCL_120018000 [Leishmania donovani]|uniref:Uncharacterized protein n=1 Tax=Leishmania donovani TaxID=5661 RepID=A0A3Q8I9H4_LEIDO|nr:hypothetical protein LdCL_120018000 [Leishmania donovani]